MSVLIIIKDRITRILADVYRNRLRKYDKVSDIVAGLINYKTMN
jgi:hypothetical protein